MAEQLSPLKAVRQKCLECSGGSSHEVLTCILTDCPLWPFRFGRRPKTVLRKRPERLDSAAVLAAARRRTISEVGGEES